jgi:hypothetical protein
MVIAGALFGLSVAVVQSAHVQFDAYNAARLLLLLITTGLPSIPGAR